MGEVLVPSRNRAYDLMDLMLIQKLQIWYVYL